MRGAHRRGWRSACGCRDRGPRTRGWNGGGITYLREHGISVDVGVRRTAATRLNEAFLTWVTKGRPFVTMKIAVSRDGKELRPAAGYAQC